VQKQKYKEEKTTQQLWNDVHLCIWQTHPIHFYCI